MDGWSETQAQWVQNQIHYFGSRQQLKKCTFDKININNETIQRSDTVKYLGGYLDQNLNFKKHVITKCKAAMINIRKIRMIRKF